MIVLKQNKTEILSIKFFKCIDVYIFNGSRLFKFKSRKAGGFDPDVFWSSVKVCANINDHLCIKNMLTKLSSNRWVYAFVQFKLIDQNHDFLVLQPTTSRHRPHFLQEALFSEKPAVATPSSLSTSCKQSQKTVIIYHPLSVYF